MSDGYKEECVDDADPTQFLAPPEKEKTKATNKPYDIKTSCWVKDEKGGFLAGEIQSEKDDKVMMKMVNPSKFSQINDMANMTFLNEASVDSLCQHYTHMRIYDLKGQRRMAKQHGEFLEDQIIQVNPVLETLDNAKTTKKKISSHFGSTTPSLIGHWAMQVSGCLPAGYSFFQPSLESKGMDRPSLYKQYHRLQAYLEKSCVISQEVAFDVLGSSPEERICVKLTRGIVHLGTMEFKQKPREEQAEADNTEVFLELWWSKRAHMGAQTQRSRCNTLFEVGVIASAPSSKLCGMEQLNQLMTALHSISPHFIHCIVPKAFKQSSRCLKQSSGKATQCLQHKLWLAEQQIFIQERKKYQSLNPSIIPPGSVDNKKASELLLGSTDLREKECRIGYNKRRDKIMMRIRGAMRDEPLAKIMTMSQCCAHDFLMRIEQRKMLERRLGLMAIQGNIQKFLQLLFWGGQKLYSRVKSLLNVAQQEEEMRKESELQSIMSKTQELREQATAEEQTAILSQEKNDLLIQLQAECYQQGILKSSNLKHDLEGLETTLSKTEKEKQALDHRVQTLTSDLSAQNDSVTKIQKEKRALEEVHQLEDKWEQEKKMHGKAEKVHHKAETDLKMTISNINEMKRTKLGRVCKEVSINCNRISQNTGSYCVQLCYIIALTALVTSERQPAKTGDGPFHPPNAKGSCKALTLLLRKERHRCAGVCPPWPSIEELEEDVEAEHAVRTLVTVSKEKKTQGSDYTSEKIVRAKLETDKQKAEMHDLSASMESLQKTKLNSDAHVHKLEDNLSEANAQLAEVEKSQAEIHATRLQVENSQLSWEHKEAQSRLNQIVHIKISLTSKADEFKRQLDEESKLVSLGNTKHDLDPMKELEEKKESKAELQCLVCKLDAEVIIWKTDAVERTKDLEETKTELAVRLQEAEEMAESVQAWIANMEKNKQRLHKVEDLTVDLEKANAACAALDKKQRTFDKMLSVATKNAELQVEVDSSHKESKGGNSIHDRGLETEKDELQVALEEAESSLEAEGSKQICMQLKAQGKVDIDRRHEKEEFETTRNNHQHAIESLWVSLETKVKGSAEALRLKKMDPDLTRMEMQLDHVNRNNSELVRTLNKLQQHVEDLGSKRMRMFASTRRSCRSSTHHLCLLQAELEEAQTGLEGSEHSWKLLVQAEQQQQQSSNDSYQISLLTIKKLEPNLQHTTNEHEEMISEYRAGDERAKEDVADLSHLPTFLPFMLVAGNLKIKELEIELDSNQKHHVETKILHKNKRPLKELLFTNDGHKTNCMQEQLEKMQNKVKTYKRQTEETPKPGRNIIHGLDGAEERGGMAESVLNKPHTRHCVSASKGLTFGEIIQVPKPSSSVSAREQAPKIALARLNPPAMNLLEQKRHSRIVPAIQQEEWWKILRKASLETQP
ncbi:LOW QUALITY PROTEIN: uncharacterized protein MYH16 [Podargus strigoides]